MKFMWSAIIAGVLFFYRKWFGVCLILMVIAMGFKNDIIGLFKESQKQHAVEVERQHQLSIEQAKIRAEEQKRKEEREEKIRVETLEREEKKRKEFLAGQQRLEKERQQNHTEAIRYHKQLEEEENRKNQEKLQREVELQQSRSRPLDIQSRYDWLTNSIKFAHKYKVDVVNYDNGTSRSLESLISEKKNIEAYLRDLTHQQNKIHDDHESKIHTAKCDGLSKLHWAEMWCVANPGQMQLTPTARWCNKSGHDQTARDYFNQLNQNNCKI